MKKVLFLIISLLIASCASTEKKGTLRDIDVIGTNQGQEKTFIRPKTPDEIRNAYSTYLKYATKDDKARIDAINRLAELEFELSDKLHKEQDNLKNTKDQELDDKLYNERLDKTIELLETSIRDYPDAKGNDKILYRLAKAYSHKGQHEDSISTLNILIKKYPKSKYYIESQFRLAENYFSLKKYMQAEDAYTDIIGSHSNNHFYEKALYKRGWSRFKQEYYLEAVDDYLSAVDYHEFGDYDKFSSTELNQFNEYFRAIGLAFSYLGGAEPLNEYFKSNPNFRYIYYTYTHVSDIYLKQQRYFDAVETQKYFIAHNPKSRKIPLSYLKIIDTWKESGFSKKAVAEIKTLYQKYNPTSSYWLFKDEDGSTYKQVNNKLKGYLLLAASLFHKQYQEKPGKEKFAKASHWYSLYLKHYRSHARKDRVYYQYAALLSKQKKYDQALKYYELSAYDEDIILNKESAYATITLSNRLFKNKKSDKNLLNKQIKYATLFVQLYPNHKRAQSIVLNAAELAFKSKQYEKAIELAESMPTLTKSPALSKSNIIKAHSYFKLGNFENAEAAYHTAIYSKHLSNREKSNVYNKLALSIYRQAEDAEKANDIENAIENYTRIVKVTPKSSTAATGLYDGIALAMKNNLWAFTIKTIKEFQRLYPKHKYSHDVRKKLSVAYLNSNQNIMAAREFERLSSSGKEKSVKIAALWQAAELYESKNEINSAIRAYEKYAKKYKKPYPQYTEALHKLTELNSQNDNQSKATYWRHQIIKADKKTPAKQKNERTRFITSNASIMLAKHEHNKFARQKLVLPLKLSLRKKKYAMQRAVRFYGQASKHGIAETATESTYKIGEIYQSFSKDLLNSERPKGLSKDELEQYVILLEDKAFPFEDKAIEFYEANMAHIRDGIYNEWVKKSHNNLKRLFPARYNRISKLDSVIDEIH